MRRTVVASLVALAALAGCGGDDEVGRGGGGETLEELRGETLTVWSNEF